MTPTQFRDHIAKLGLSQEQAGLWMGYSPRQGQRWALGECEVPVAVARLLRFMVQFKLSPDDVK
jgi:hypothetical protein